MNFPHRMYELPLTLGLRFHICLLACVAVVLRAERLYKPGYSCPL